MKLGEVLGESEAGEEGGGYKEELHGVVVLIMTQLRVYLCRCLVRCDSGKDCRVRGVVRQDAVGR